VRQITTRSEIAAQLRHDRCAATPRWTWNSGSLESISGSSAIEG
jgi:hypothetical protein